MDLKEAIQMVEKEVREVEWRILGRELGLTDPELDNINHDYRNNGLQEIVHRMLFDWNQKQGSDATVEKLASGLVLSGLWKLATVIHPGDENCLINQDYCKTLEASLSNEEKLALQDMIAMLRQRYSSMELPHFAWEEDTTLPLEELYVELSLCQMDKWDEEGTPIKIEEVFRVNHISPSTIESIKKRYLIEGAPGYGKTTMLTKIGYDWATKKSYANEQFNVVIILSLRELNGSFNDLLNDAISIKGHSNSTLVTLLQKLQSQTLLLLDGYDELPSGNHDDVYKLLKGEQYPRMTIFLTSRLRYTDILRTLGSFWNQRIEIKGISEEQRKEFLSKYLKVSPEVVEEKMSIVFKKPLDGLFECPLFLILIATVTEQKLLNAISTKTQLYKIVFTFMVRRSLIREKLLGETVSFVLFDNHHDSILKRLINWTFGNFKTCCYYHMLVLFGEFAVSMIKQNKVHFHKDEVLQICGNCKEIFCLGFLMPTVKINSTRKRETNYYQPVHKSFLEFLAALYLADLAKNDNRIVFTNKVQDLLKSGLQSESTVFLFSFLGGLLGDKAYWLLEDVIYVSESMFSSTERERIFEVLSDMNASEELMKCVNRILPNCMNIDEYSYQKQARASIQCGLVKTLEVSLGPMSILPVVNIENVVANINEDLFPNPLIKERQMSKKLACKHLICNMHSSIFSHWDGVEMRLSEISAETISYYMEHSGTSINYELNSEQLIEMGNKTLSITSMTASAIDLKYTTEFLQKSNIIQQLAIHFKSLLNITNELVLQFFSAVLSQKHLHKCVISLPSGKQMLIWREQFYIAVNMQHEIEKENTPENRRNVPLKVTLGCNNLDVADFKLIINEEIMDGLYFIDDHAKLTKKQCNLMKEIIFYYLTDLCIYPNVETVILTDMQLLSSIFEINHPHLRLIVVYNDYLGHLDDYSHPNKQIEETHNYKGSFKKKGEFDNFHHSFMLTTSMDYKPCNEVLTTIPKSNKPTLKLFTNLLAMDYLKKNLNQIKNAMMKNHIVRCIVVCKHRLPNKGLWTSSTFKSFLQRTFPSFFFSITEQLNEPLCMLETFPNTEDNYEFYREYVITCNPINVINFKGIST